MAPPRRHLWKEAEKTRRHALWAKVATTALVLSAGCLGWTAKGATASGDPVIAAQVESLRQEFHEAIRQINKRLDEKR